MPKHTTRTTVVSIRIPSSLVKELEDITRKEHFLDISESIRSIIRNKWFEINGQAYGENKLAQIQRLLGDVK